MNTKHKIKQFFFNIYEKHHFYFNILCSLSFMCIFGFIFLDILEITKQSFKKELYNIETLKVALENIKIHYFALLIFATISLYTSLFYKKINIILVFFFTLVSYSISLYLPTHFFNPLFLLPGLLILTVLFFIKNERCKERVFVWTYVFMILVASFTFYQAIHKGIFQNYQKRELVAFSLKNEKNEVSCLTNPCTSVKNNIFDNNTSNEVTKFIEQYGKEILIDLNAHKGKKHSQYYISNIDGILVGFQPREGYTIIIFETQSIEHELLFSRLWIYYLSIFAYTFWIFFIHMLYFLHSSKRFKSFFIKS